MARYIDAEKFISELEEEKTVALEFEDGVAVYEIEHTMNLIGMQPTADVVPRDLYEKRVREVEETMECYELARQIVASEIFEEIDVLVDDYKHSYIQSIQLIAELAELKKKYTEE